MNARAIALVAKEQERWELAGDQLFIDLDLSTDNLPPGTQVKQLVSEGAVRVSAAALANCRAGVATIGRPRHPDVQAEHRRAVREVAESYDCALIDLFDTDHARRVLAAFGRAFVRLPEDQSQTSKDQKAFLRDAVAGLADFEPYVDAQVVITADLDSGTRPRFETRGRHAHFVGSYRKVGNHIIAGIGTDCLSLGAGRGIGCHYDRVGNYSAGAVGNQAGNRAESGLSMQGSDDKGQRQGASVR